MKEKTKVSKKKLFAILILSILALLLFFCLCGPFSPFEGIRKAYNAPKELVSLRAGQPDIADEMHITAHRGVNAYAPENTLPAYEKAIELGYYSAECDIKQTSDGTWVLYHDPTLFTRFLKPGAVADKDLKTLQSYSYKTGSGFWLYNLRIPTLEEYLDLFATASTRPQIEIKTKKYDSLATVVDAIEKRGLTQKAIIISFDYEQLQQIRQLSPDLELWYLVYKIKEDDVEKAKALGNCWISADFGLNNEKTIRLCLEQDVGLSLWTVNKAEDAKKLYDMGVRYIETDRLY